MVRSSAELARPGHDAPSRRLDRDQPAPPASARARQGGHLLDALLLTALTLWLGARASAFHGTPEGYDAFGHIAKVRFLIENWPHVSWNYSWYSGMPTFQGSYPPGYHGLVALLAEPLGLGISTAMNAVTLGSMLAIVLGCYSTVLTVTSERRWACVSAALLLGTPALWSHAVETGLLPRLLGMGFTALALAAAARFAVRGGRVAFAVAAFATAAALSSHVIVGVLALGLVAGVLLVGPRSTAWARAAEAVLSAAVALGLTAYFYLPLAIIGGAQSPFTDAVTELGWRNVLWPEDGSLSGLSPLLVLAGLLAGVVAARRLRPPTVGLADKRALGLDVLWLSHPVGPVPPRSTAAVRRWARWRTRLAVEGFPLRLALLLLAGFPCVLAYGTVGYVLDPFPLFVGGLQPSDLLGYLALLGATAVGLVGGSVLRSWPARLGKGRRPVRVIALASGALSVASVVLATAAALPGAARGNASPTNPATADWLDPSWSAQRQLRVTGAADSATNVVNAVSRVPQTRGYQANGILQLDWQVWLEQSQLDPGTPAAVQDYLLDWHGVGWVLADSRKESLARYTGDATRFAPVAGTGDVRSFAYGPATPVLGASDAPTVLVVGDDAHYDLVLRALSHGGLGSSRLVTLQGPAAVDELIGADLSFADTVLLYGSTVRDAAAATSTLRTYVAGGGRLVVDDSDGSLAELAGQAESVLPVLRQREVSVSGSWGWQAPPDPLTDGVDVNAFGPPSYGGSGRWDVQAASSLNPWARPLLSSSGGVVAAAGQIGRGQSVWSGIGLPYHAASFGSAEEAELVGRLVGAREAAVAPEAVARFVHSQRREITVGPEARGVLFKEHVARGWHATAGGEELRIAAAGPGMMYVPLPARTGTSTVVLTYRSGRVEQVGGAVSLLALVGVLAFLAWRPRRRARAELPRPARARRGAARR